MSAETRTLVLILRGEIARAGSRSAWARQHRIPLRHVYMVLEGEEPSDKVLAALGLERVVTVTYRRRA